MYRPYGDQRREGGSPCGHRAIGAGRIALSDNGAPLRDLDNPTSRVPCARPCKQTHLLTSRSSGNLDLHRFLAIADRVVRAQGRKIPFTTHLRNVNDIYPAVMRPGCCFATLHTRQVMPAEGSKLIARLCVGDAEREQVAFERTYPQGTKTGSVAATYRACGGLSD